jgi:hypothetical protein
MFEYLPDSLLTKAHHAILPLASYNLVSLSFKLSKPFGFLPPPPPHHTGGTIYYCNTVLRTCERERDGWALDFLERIRYPAVLFFKVGNCRVYVML